MKWDAKDVDSTTRRLEETVQERLAQYGIELHLSEDKWDAVDGHTTKNGQLSAYCEIKTRTEPLGRFIEWGTVLFDAVKLDRLRDKAQKWNAKAILIVLTADDQLLFHPLTARHIREIRSCRKNHHSYEMVNKEVELVPIHSFKLLKDLSGQGTDWTWDEIGHGLKFWETQDFIDEVLERASVMHFDGGVCPLLAEKIAAYDLTKIWLERGHK